MVNSSNMDHRWVLGSAPVHRSRSRRLDLHSSHRALRQARRRSELVSSALRAVARCCGGELGVGPRELEELLRAVELQLQKEISAHWTQEQADRRALALAEDQLDDIAEDDDDF